MNLRVVLLLAVALAAPAGAQVYRWTDEQGRVHYGDKPPPGKPAATLEKPPAAPPAQTMPGSGTHAISGGRQITVPLPTPTPEQLERERRQIEESEREMDERDRREFAAQRYTPAGIHYCNSIEEWIAKAKAGPLPRYDGPPGGYATKEEQAAFLKDLTQKRDRYCRP